MEAIKEIQVTSLSQLLEMATPSAPEPASGRRRRTAVWRGSACGPDADLLTSLDRLGGNPPHRKAHLEEHILRNFIRYARPYLDTSNLDVWELLFVAEHHGVPTRLLNWSYSPLIAAHFATAHPEPNIDRVIWELDWRAVQEQFGFRPLTFLAHDLEQVVQSRGFSSAWDLLNSNDEQKNNFVCVVDPPAIDQRIVAQGAAFTLSGSKKQSLLATLQKSGLNHALTRYIIPADSVDFIRDQLDLCGVDYRRLFPGLDGVAAEIRRYYGAG